MLKSSQLPRTVPQIKIFEILSDLKHCANKGLEFLRIYECFYFQLQEIVIYYASRFPSPFNYRKDLVKSLK